MSILIDRQTQVLVQGVTGRSGALQTRIMKKYGTRVVAGVTPGKGGTEVEGIPVFDFIAQAARRHRIDAVISFVPGRFAEDACREAADAGVPLLVLTTEGIPDHDVLRLIRHARSRGMRVLGPGTAGLIAPGRCKLGAHPDRMFSEGPVGIVSKSGALSYEAGKTLTEAGIGQSTVVGIGGGPIWGMTQADVLMLFEEDPETEVIVLLGEIGGGMEEDAAACIAERIHKPVVGLIVGRSAPPGASLGHAGAIIQGGRGTAAGKMKALVEAGARVVSNTGQMVRAVRELLEEGR